MKRVIVTGASGFIGGVLVKRLLSEGVSVWAVGRNTDKLNALKQYGDCIPVSADFEDYDKLDVLIPERGFDRFYHLAWRGTSTNDYNYNDYNVQVANVKASCDAAYSAVKLECARSSSSSSSYQQADVLTAKHGDFNPVLYGIVKRAAAELFKAIAYKNGMPCVNLIFPNTYGVGDKPNTAIVFFIKSLLANKPLNLISGMYRDDWMEVNELVGGIIAASKPELKYGDYYVGHRNITTFREKLEAMKAVLGSSSKLNWGEYPESYYVDYDRYDLDALYRDTGWKATLDFDAAISQVADWLQNIAPPPPRKIYLIIYGISYLAFLRKAVRI